MVECWLLPLSAGSSLNPGTRECKNFFSSLFNHISPLKNPTHFIEVLLTHAEQCIFNIYNSMTLEISIYLKNHHHNLCHEQTYHVRKFPPALFIVSVITILCACMLNDHNCSPLASPPAAPGPHPHYDFAWPLLGVHRSKAWLSKGGRTAELI